MNASRNCYCLRTKWSANRARQFNNNQIKTRTCRPAKTESDPVLLQCCSSVISVREFSVWRVGFLKNIPARFLNV